jgi:FkbM family methyltransferase
MSNALLKSFNPIYSLLRLSSRLSKFWLNYGNPLDILFKRYFDKTGIMTVIDRNTGIRCNCTVASYQMFGETWYNKDYEIPHFPIRQGDVVIDIGANQGFFACYAASKGAKVYAFEPFTNSFQTLIENLELNHLSSQVTAQPWAIGGQNGSVELISTDTLGSGMNTTQPEFVKNVQIKVSEKTQVPCFTLNHIIEEFNLNKIRLCKIDCEGAELEILQQLDKAHLSKIDAFVLEYHPAYPFDSLMQLLMSWGTHQISFAEDNEHCPRNILRLVSNQELAQNDGY